MDGLISQRYKSKILFSVFVSELNKKGTKKYLNNNSIKHLNILIKMWSDTKKCNNPKHFFNMKKHHSHINGLIKDEYLLTLWNNYLESIMHLRLMINMLLI